MVDLWAMPDSHPTKLCPRCGKVKRYNPEDGGDFYRRKVVRKVESCDEVSGEIVLIDGLVVGPTALCRECEKKRVARARQEKHALARLAALDPVAAEKAHARRLGPCDCCGGKASNRSIITDPRRAVICSMCRDLLEQCGGAWTIARDYWVSSVHHLADERRLDGEWARRTDRRRKWHEGNSEAGPGSPPHEHCIMMEAYWKAVAKFLTPVKANLPRS